MSGGLRTSGEARHGDRLLEDRRKIGAFYTPEPLSEILSNWAIRSSTDTVLEPSFGGCGFLQSAKKRLTDLGCHEPRQQIYGCDVDPVAFTYLAEIFSGPVDLKRFVQTDFLDMQHSGEWPGRFSTILANPPYIPYQEICTERRQSLSNRSWAIEGVSGRASLWAYFVAHALSFLEDKGRMAWVLPGAFLQADYGQSIRTYLATNFRRVAAFVLRERIFLEAGTDEETVILLADGYRDNCSSSQIELGEAQTFGKLSQLIDKWDSGVWRGRPADGRPAALCLSNAEHRLFTKLAESGACKKLGEIASVRIGLVTGANDFFVLTEEKRKAVGLENSDCKPILAKLVAAPGASLTLQDHARYLALGGRGHLVDSDGKTGGPGIEAYLKTFPDEQRESISTFKKRQIWSKIDDGKIPDAFFPVMHQFGPRLILNPDGLTCTNTIHRVYFKESMSILYQWQLAAVSILTTFSQLSAELVGRRYGSGVLKHEPREAEEIMILLPKVKASTLDKAFRAIDKDLRASDRSSAMQRADALIYGATLQDDWKAVSARLSRILERVRRRRRPNRSLKKASHGC
ncbi:N-6 DNA methylase [Methylosinus sp. sav-2]|nr:N-6 DNA methylase [Methylosinus sp. sav-2]